MRDAPDNRPYDLKRKNALQKAKAGVPGSLTAEEARIVHRVKQSTKEKNKKQRERVANATYRHSSIVQSLNRQNDTLKQELMRVNRENKAFKARDEERNAYLTSLEDFVESNPNVASVRRQYG